MLITVRVIDLHGGSSADLRLLPHQVIF
jgi:hypothetical protein